MTLLLLFLYASGLEKIQHSHSFSKFFSIIISSKFPVRVMAILKSKVGATEKLSVDLLQAVS